MIEIFENGRKVAEMPESEFWALSGPQKRALIEAQKMTGRKFGFDLKSSASDSTNIRVDRAVSR